MAVNQNFKESTVSTSNHTQNYDLPLWTEGDKTSWLTQVNDAMNKIDSGMVDAKSKALEVVGIAADAKKLAEETSAESKESAKTVAGYNDRLTAVEATSVEHTNDITALNTRCDQMDVEIHSVKETQKKTTEDLGTLADQVKHNKEDADATKQSVSVLNGNVVELTGRVTTCEDDIEALKVTTAANTKNIAKAEENVATVTGKVTALETEVGEISAATQSNTTAISAINASIESIKAKDTEQDGKIATNTTEISSLDGRVTALEDGGSGSGGKNNSGKVKNRYTGIVTTSYYAGATVGNIKCDYLVFEDGSEAIDLYSTASIYTDPLFTTTGEDIRNNATFSLLVEFSDFPATLDASVVADMSEIVGIRYVGGTVSGTRMHSVFINTSPGNAKNRLSIVFHFTDVTKTPVGPFLPPVVGTWRFVLRGMDK